MKKKTRISIRKIAKVKDILTHRNKTKRFRQQFKIKEKKPDSSRPKVKLEANQKTSASEQRKIPVKVDARLVKHIKPNNEINSIQILTVPSQESYDPVWFCSIPLDIKDFDKKERSIKVSSMD